MINCELNICRELDISSNTFYGQYWKVKKEKRGLRNSLLRCTVGYVCTNLTYFSKSHLVSFHIRCAKNPRCLSFLKLDSHKGRHIRFKCQKCKTLSELNSGLYGK